MQSYATDELQTLGDFIRWAASRFQANDLHFGHGSDNAIDEAAALVLGGLHLPPDLHSDYFACRVTADERATLGQLIQARLEQRRPVAYLLGEAWFCGLAFAVNDQVLIPRSPIGEMIEDGFSPWLDASEVTRIADIGTGSGCIAIACALAFPQAQVDALDNAPAALALTARNAAAHGVASRVRGLESNWLEATAPEPAFDLIVSNPPYVDAEAMAALPAEYRHEPQAALAAGADGLDAVRAILPQAAQRLTERGVLVCEIGHGQAAFTQAFPELPVTWVSLARGGAGVFVIDGLSLRAAYAPADGPLRTE